MGFADAVRSAFARYASFSGRASRSEYWWFYLFIVLVSIVGGLIDLYALYFDPSDPTAVPWASFLMVLPLLIPGIAVAVRRLHDTDRSGWWYLIGLVPLIGTLVLLIFFVQRGTDGPNRYGSDPLQAA